MIASALKLWFDTESNRITPITIGNLNQTSVVENEAGRFVLQKLNPIFAPEVNFDIQAFTSHLNEKGLATTRLIPTRSGDLWGELDGQCWRLLSFVAGENFSTLASSEQAKEAGLMVGNFHRAVSDFQHQYKFSRGDVHDTKSHLSKLRSAVEKYHDHEQIDEVSAFSEKILDASQDLPDLSTLPKRHSHGDLKINNIIFGSNTKEHSLIDLDTIGLMAWPLEMGDAFRSWCNPKGENAEATGFNEDYFEAALTSYADAASDLWTRAEVTHLIDGIRTIPLELSSRFLRDVLEDCYFGYDPARFDSRSAHNFVRAKGQFAVYCDIENKKARLEQIIKRAFA
jgi:Ser/Thr protein kinase RdoA (MazF antagonist)